MATVVLSLAFLYRTCSDRRHSMGYGGRGGGGGRRDYGRGGYEYNERRYVGLCACVHVRALVVESAHYRASDDPRTYSSFNSFDGSL